MKINFKFDYLIDLSGFAVKCFSFKFNKATTGSKIPENEYNN